MPEEEIRPEFPYIPRYAEVLGSRMCYVEAGEGDPILLTAREPDVVVPVAGGHSTFDGAGAVRGAGPDRDGEV